ncbi:MAG TPA: hypothetical protein ENJ37_03260 [Deltaproteobacteria bacterium]|nr:hypothetical protein [Deltaproteobacteria bacterium]
MNVSGIVLNVYNFYGGEEAIDVTGVRDPLPGYAVDGDAARERGDPSTQRDVIELARHGRVWSSVGRSGEESVYRRPARQRTAGAAGGAYSTYNSRGLWEGREARRGTILDVYA